MRTPRATAGSPVPRRTKRNLFFAAKAVISVALVGGILAKVGIGPVIERIGAIDPALFALAVALTFLQLALGVWRWQRVIAALNLEMPFTRLFSAFYAGVFWNAFLPGSVGGDFIRGWKAFRAGIPLVAAVNSTLLDRASTLLALLLVSAALTMPLYSTFGSFALVFPPLAFAAVGGIGAIMLLELLPQSWRKWRLVRAFVYLSADCRKVYLRPRPLCEIVGLSIVVTIVMSLSVYTLARGIGLAVTPLQSLLLVPPTVVITILPVSISGWGVREVGFVYAFGTIGVPPEAALSLSILFGITNLIVAIPGGIFWLKQDEEPAPDGARAGNESDARP